MTITGKITLTKSEGWEGMQVQTEKNYPAEGDLPGYTPIPRNRSMQEVYGYWFTQIMVSILRDVLSMMKFCSPGAVNFHSCICVDMKHQEGGWEKDSYGCYLWIWQEFGSASGILSNS